MTHSELWERINLTMESPPCIIEFDRSNGFAWWEYELPYACIGVAVAMVGYDLDERFIERSFRAELLGWEWSYLMHFEMAINALFRGRILDYGRTGYFPFVKYQYLPFLNENNYQLLKNVLLP